MVLAECQPVPLRVHRNGVASCVLAEIPKEMALEDGCPTAKLREASREILVHVRAATKREVGPVEPEFLVPRVCEEEFLQLSPAADADVVHPWRFSAEGPELHSLRGAGTRPSTRLRASP